MQKLLFIFIGSGFGGLLRYTIGGWTQRLVSGAFPLGTMVVNLTGCFLIGFLSAAFAGRWFVREEYRVAILIGILGGYTTFSTFGFETFALLNDRQYLVAAANAVLSVALGVIGVWAGYRIAESWLGV